MAIWSDKPDVVAKAAAFAAKKHSGQIRKGSGSPYIIHPFEVLSIIITVSDNEDLMAAALLHDTMEDCGVTKRTLTRCFGKRVAELVSKASEKKCTDSVNTWRERKEASLEHLRHESDQDSTLLALADKLSNIRSMMRDYNRQGESFWNCFNASREQQHWLYHQYADIFSSMMKYEIGQEFSKRVAFLFPEK